MTFNALVPIKANREDIDQMVAKMMYSRKMKRKVVDGSSASGITTPPIVDQRLKEKLQELEAKNGELETLRAALKANEKKLESFRDALEAKQRELAAKDDEMERIRRGALAAQAEWYVQGRDEIIVKAKQVGLNYKLLLPDPADDFTD